MKKINKVLIFIITVMLIAGLYFRFGTGLKVHAAAAREGGDIRCELTLSNGSLFNYEYFEFIVLSPEGAHADGGGLAGGDIVRLSQGRTTLQISGAGEGECRVEIGYYVLGARRSVTVTVR